MKKYEITWTDGSIEIMEGVSISNAFMNAGYGAGALRAIDSWKELSEDIEE